MWAVHENGGDTWSDKFNDRLDLYLVSAKFNELSEKTRIQYDCVAKTLRKYFQDATLSSIKPQHIALWMDNHKSKVQANTGKAIISNVFEVACRHGLVDSNPTKAIKYHHLAGRDTLITDDEYRKIWNAADDHIRIAMDIAYLTGARIRDILDIRLQDILSDGVYIKVGKTGKKMLFVWSDGLQEVVARARALPRSIRGMHLICDRQGKPYKYGTFNEHWLKTIRPLGLDGLHFHDIRAKAATDAKELGMDYQSLLGHASRAMSDRYLRTREIERVAPLARSVPTIL
jgi:integrase